jgi:hypothetical protein
MDFEYIDVDGRKVGLHKDIWESQSFAVVPCEGIGDYFRNSSGMAKTIENKRDIRDGIRGVLSVFFEIDGLKILNRSDERKYHLDTDMMSDGVWVNCRDYQLTDRKPWEKRISWILNAYVELNVDQPEEAKRMLEFKEGDIVDVRVEQYRLDLTNNKKIIGIRPAGTQDFLEKQYFDPYE